MPTVKPETLIPRVAAAVLRDCLLLQKPVETRTPSGAVVKTWEDVDNEVWADVRPLSGAALWYAQQFAPKATATILIRFRSDIAADWRFVTNDGIPYHIRAVPIDVENKGALILTHCEALQIGAV